MPTHTIVLNNFRSWRVDTDKLADVIAVLEAVALPEPQRPVDPPPAVRRGSGSGGSV